MKIRLSFFILLVCFMQSCFGVPLQNIKVPKLKGKVVGLLWYSSQKVVASDKDIQVHKDSTSDQYFLILDNHNLKKEVSTNVSWYSRVSSATQSNVFQERKLQKGQVLIILSSPLMKELKKGSQIDLTNYIVGGDEFGTSGVCESIEIDGKAIKQKKPPKANNSCHTTSYKAQ